MDSARGLLLECFGPSPVLDWVARPASELEALADLARRHRVEPLLLMRLRASASGAPDSLISVLRTAAQQVARSNLQRWATLARILEHFAARRLPVVVLKGADLAERFYGSLALRPMQDIDLLVPEARLEEADALLRGLGLGADPGNTAYQRRAHYCFTYWDENGHGVEVHWHLVGEELPGRIDLDGVWERSVPTTAARQPARAMAPEDLLVYLSAHLAKHEFALGLLALCDVDAVVSKFGGAIDWHAALARARSWGVLNATLLTLCLCRRLVGTPLPWDRVVTLAGEAIGTEVETTAVERVLSATPSDPLESHSWNFRRAIATPGLCARARIVHQSVFRPRGWMAQRYGLRTESWRVYPLYGVRVGELLWRYSREVGRRFRNGRQGALPARDVEALLRWVKVA